MQEIFVLRKVILDEDGRPENFEYIKVNPAYERISGRKATDVIGKLFTEIYPTIKEESFDWIKGLGDVALTGKPKSFELYFDPGGKIQRV